MKHLFPTLAFALAGLANMASAHDGAHAQRASMSSSASEDFTAIEKKSRDYFSNTVLVTQDGRSVRFFADVLKNRTVLINVVFTRCQDACPMITRTLVDVRRALGESSEVRFVSISVDPSRDTPAALREFARKHQAQHPEWLFLTGRREAVEHVTRRLGQYASEPEMHTSLLIAGNTARGHWVKIKPDLKPELIAERLRELAQP